ncbi:MAG: ribonucleotide-diphosphate reductase subunit beta [Flavobacterium sp.]|uniref:ribonucleotide-diphosphate reductase subunit beta n=1 Tax=Flavobacterium sp. TaxID=239 RepID=UPI0026255EDB|nr:ribonucleotide-diphosphate reductase subunit beta [Flavobacterium sp.]MDD5151509.1 ribonucleotide-diphosphate reductase subunit beta [Flavobacterium sp.]
MEKKTTYTIDYPIALKFIEEQNSIMWFPTEIDVEKDLHDLRTNFTKSEYHAVTTLLKLFLKYELEIGNEYWSNYVAKVFPRPEIQRMANCFSFIEINVHAPFYNKLNEILGLNTDEFYESYIDIPALKNRMEWIGRRVEKRDSVFDILKSVGIFSILEGAVLYSSFAFLKHFQAEGKNKLMATNSGIGFSVNDENLHSLAGAWLFKTLLDEAKQEKAITEEDIIRLEQEIYETSHIIKEHEFEIINLFFEKGSIKGITPHQLQNFVESRIDLCLQQLGLKKIFNPSYNPIKDWFYKNINGSKLHDFFSQMNNGYARTWVKSKFIWTGMKL